MSQYGQVRSLVLVAVTCLMGALWVACGSNGAPNKSNENGADASAPPSDGQVTPTPDGPVGPGADAADAPFLVPDDGAAPSLLPPPAHGAFFGAFVGAEPETQTDPQSELLFTNEEALIGRKWVIDNRFYDDTIDWTGDRTKWDIAQHIVPLVTWQPSGNGHPLDEILAGSLDALITSRAQSAKALGAQILLRWGHEMNGNWYPWSGSESGGGDAGVLGDGGGEGGAGLSGPEKYVAAWRHVHDIFVQVGATNVVWIWCIIVTDVPSDPWNHWTNYYPGDAYVDWVGLDAYNWGSSSSCCVWESFTDLIDSPYQDYATRKPIMLPETASAEVGGDKGAWITAMHAAIVSQYTDIKAVVWFDINKETDWRIASSPSALAAYKAMALDPYFSP
jgi:hypothetical protein